MTPDRKFVLYWRDGKREIVTGPDVAKAMTLAGYGGGAVRALDFWSIYGDNEYTWDGAAREWRAPNPAPSR